MDDKPLVSAIVTTKNGECEYECAEKSVDYRDYWPGRFIFGGIFAE